MICQVSYCLNFSVDLKLADIAEWDPARIAALFSGIAQVKKAIAQAQEERK